MQIISFELSQSHFYCPITGVQLLSEVDYHSSPATLFCFTTIQGGELIDPKPEIELQYNATLDEISKGLYSDYKFKYDSSDKAKAFDILVRLKLKDKSNYVLFEICDSDIACGPVSNSVFIGIDMNYKEILDANAIDKESFDFCFSGFDDYESVLIDASEIKPTTDGYGLFMEDTMGCGGFYFITTEEEWATLLPALIALDYVNQEYSTIPIEAFKSLKKVYLDYFNTGLYKQLPQDFTSDLNAVLTDYKIVFFGKVTDLFEANSEFSTELLEEFDNNPKTQLNDFLTFLSTYSKY